jgi:hypothetical protein
MIEFVIALLVGLTPIYGILFHIEHRLTKLEEAMK